MKYEDIITMNRPVSKYPKMSISDRAAQFSAFAALTGYDDKVKETARIVDEKITLDEESLSLLDKSFKEIEKEIRKKPEVYITYFINDSKKIGGMYVDEVKKIIKIDYDNQKLLFQDEKEIEFEDIYAIELKRD